MSPCRSGGLSSSFALELVLGKRSYTILWLDILIALTFKDFFHADDESIVHVFSYFKKRIVVNVSPKDTLASAFLKMLFQTTFPNH